MDDSVPKYKRNHLNGQEPEIKFTKEEEEDNKIAVLDLELNVNRKKKKIEFIVHYKKANANITLKKQSNHRVSTKRGVIQIEREHCVIQNTCKKKWRTLRMYGEEKETRGIQQDRETAQLPSNYTS